VKAVGYESVRKWQVNENIQGDRELMPPFSKLLRKILGRFLNLEKSQENIQQNTNLKSGNNKAIKIVNNTTIFASCWTLLRDVVVES